ncbi:uncharacterized protein LOC125673605 isoform X2 [Ostrea edulis]|uniref:uncharacterized protein LOC125673605 isoform X2 n=1 Tax=Ostrea edulis TaxID=37623 RepID=UPI0024AF4683|nr:uncharacterized protein LOC125673605 isoform X2 [Ostrea edulis]
MVTQPMMGESILAVGLMVLFFHINPILGNSCPSTTATIKIVDECPKTEQAWKDAAARKGCHMLAATQYCSKFQYHCLVNQWQNATLEVCAPIWYISGFCVMFNTDEKRVIDNFRLDCTKFRDPCPTRYISTDAYKYQKCYEVLNKTKQISNQFQEDKVVPTPCSSDTPWREIAVVFIVLSALMCVGIPLTVLYRRRKHPLSCQNARDTSEKHKNPEGGDLDITTQNEEAALLGSEELTTSAHYKNAPEEEKMARENDKKQLDRKGVVSNATYKATERNQPMPERRQLACSAKNGESNKEKSKDLQSEKERGVNSDTPKDDVADKKNAEKSKDLRSEMERRVNSDTPKDEVADKKNAEKSKDLRSEMERRVNSDTPKDEVADKKNAEKSVNNDFQCEMERRVNSDTPKDEVADKKNAEETVQKDRASNQVQNEEENGVNKNTPKETGTVVAAEGNTEENRVNEECIQSLKDKEEKADKDDGTIAHVENKGEEDGIGPEGHTTKDEKGNLVAVRIYMFEGGRKN